MREICLQSRKELLPKFPTIAVLDMFRDTSKDVSDFESEFECCQNPTILGKSEIKQIYGHVYVKFGLTLHCIKLSFIFHRCPSFAMPKKTNAH